MYRYQYFIGKYPPNYNEAEVPAYSLPALRSREETLQLFRDHMHGHLPIETPRMEVTVLEDKPDALGGKAHRRQLRVELSNSHGRASFDLLVYLPAGKQRVPIFLGLNFHGNHAAQDDQAVSPPRGFRFGQQEKNGQGSEASRWPWESIVQRGFGAATVYAGDIAPDSIEHVGEGIFRLLPPDATDPGLRGGAIAAWGWGLGRALDALLTVPEIDGSRVAVMGHSRMGKAALWAGAIDKRFYLTISNNSGSGGACVARRKFGERLVHTNNCNPHWFASAYHRFNEHEEDLPHDQHQLIALTAPRAVYVASAEKDNWADPRGEYLALTAAAPAWGQTLPQEMPPLDQPLNQGPLGYHIRRGEHDITAQDWDNYLRFAESQLSADS